jgi:hypothetical protein
MKEILKLLEDSHFVTEFKIEEYREFKEGFFLKIKADIVDGSSLFLREYSDSIERNYSYHWQDSNSNLLVRWDNSPFHKKISTYPHHKHVGTEILPSYEITINDVLTFMDKRIPKK